MLPEHKCYVEVFAGAANILFAKDPSKAEVINDVNADLVNLFRVVRFHKREFMRHLAFVTHSRQEFQDFKAQPGLTDIQRAARTFVIFKSAFGGMGGTGHRAFGYSTTQTSRFKRTTMAAVTKCHKRLSNVTVENLDFEDLIRRYDRKHTFFYCDPPYLETAKYATSFEFEDHQRLAAKLKKIKGKFLLSINDHPEIRKLYKGLPRLKVKVKYSLARDKKAASRDRSELVIANYPLPKKW